MLMRIPVDLCYFRLHDARILNTAEAVSFTSGLSRTEQNRLAVIFILLYSIHHPFLSGKRGDAKKRHENDEHEYNSTHRSNVHISNLKSHACHLLRFLSACRTIIYKVSMIRGETRRKAAKISDGPAIAR